MTYEEYINVVENQVRRNPSWRIGQTYFNELYRINPELAEKVRGTNIDPFYRDGAVRAFLEYVYRYYEAFASLSDERYTRA